MERLAKIVSWVFLPLLTPIYALVIVMFVPSWEKNILQPNSLYVLTTGQKMSVVYLFTLFCFLAPSIVIVMMRFQGMLSSVMMENRKERYIPAFATVISGIALVYIIATKIPPELFGFGFLLGIALGALATVIICTMLTFVYKVSLHAAGMGILCGFLMVYNAHMYLFELKYVVIAFLASGLVMSMRMVLKAHNYAQSVIGFCIGFSVTFCTVLGTLLYL